MDNEKLHDEIIMAQNENNTSLLKNLIKKKDKLETEEIKELGEIEGTYPLLNDPEFNDKIVMKREFYETKYDDNLHEKDIETYADIYSNAAFELAPHQLFVRNFLSSYTPYNSLLIYHGLGTGKTCTAIGICEDTRKYNKQMNINKRIIIVASPNVQNNFRTQLFDKRKLKKENGRWILEDCVAQSMIDEKIPTSADVITEDKLVKSINNMINTNYTFMGYTEFGNYIQRIKDRHKTNPEMQTRALYREFSNRLVVIDEVHNLRINKSLPTDGNDEAKKTAQNLYNVVEVVENLKLLLLSATPLYNSYREIVWLINLMRANDRKPPIYIKDIFTKDGTFIEKDGKEIGKELLIEASRGYVSYVKGENPFVFPFRIYPQQFSPENSTMNEDFEHPEQQIDGSDIREISTLRNLDLYRISLNEYQEQAYEIARNFVMKDKSSKKRKSESDLDNIFDLQTIDIPKRTLTMVYPTDELNEYVNASESERSNIRPPNPKTFTGETGLHEIMKRKRSQKNNYAYKGETRIFSHSEIGKYSAKIKNILDMIPKTKGPIIVYSEYIDGGCVPLALALEEFGLSRAGTLRSNLFEKSPSEKFDLSTNTHTKNPAIPAYYSMITGDSIHSPSNDTEVKLATNEDNKDGHKVKVIIISKAGSEGIDFKYIRQMHLLEPWFNLGRIEQIIGRAIRFRSHQLLPLQERNTEIYMYATHKNGAPEYIDFYLYRFALHKAIKIGAISRTLKENAVDCVLNSGINNLNADKMKQSLTIVSGTGREIEYNVGSQAYSSLCDYMEDCDYKCNVNVDSKNLGIKMDTFQTSFIAMNSQKIMQDIKSLFKKQYIYEKDELITELTLVRKIPIIQIDYALERMVDPAHNVIIQDMLGRSGRLTNIGKYYAFQPIETNEQALSVYDRSHPFGTRQRTITFSLPDKIIETNFITEEEPSDKKSKSKSIRRKIVALKPVKTLLLKNTEKIFNHIKDGNEEALQGDDNKWNRSAITALEYISYFDSAFNGGYHIVGHLFDSANYDSKVLFIKQIHKLGEKRSEFVELLNNYIEANYMIEENIYMLADNGEVKFVEINHDNGKVEEVKGLKGEEIINKLVKFGVGDNVNETIGFMIYTPRRDAILFKTKNISTKRSRGQLCSNSTRTKAMKLAEEIIMMKGYSMSKDKKTLLDSYKPEILCAIQEILLREYNRSKLNDKLYFFTEEQQDINKIGKN